MDGFLAMGGYAAYVWPSYGIAALLLAVLLAASLSALKSREAELAALGGRDEDGDEA
jgi:heme exporter protein D